MTGFDEFDSLLGELGKNETGKSCLYVNKLDDVNFEILEELIEKSVEYMKRRDASN